LESEELGRYEDCKEKTKANVEQEKAIARQIICCREQQENREPVEFPKDYHIDPGIMKKVFVHKKVTTI